MSEDPKEKDEALRAFIERAVTLGVDDAESLAELVPNEELQRRIKEAAALNPAVGREETVDDLVQEILLLEKKEASEEK